MLFLGLLIDFNCIVNYFYNSVCMPSSVVRRKLKNNSYVSAGVLSIPLKRTIHF